MSTLGLEGILFLCSLFVQSLLTWELPIGRVVGYLRVILKKPKILSIWHFGLIAKIIVISTV
jgi:hypothetical protein